MVKHGQLMPKRGILAPQSGWQRNGVYRVLVSFSSGNPAHEALLHVGFVEDERGNFKAGEKTPVYEHGPQLGSYSQVWQNSYDRPYDIGEIWYLEPIEQLCVLNKE